MIKSIYAIPRIAIAHPLFSNLSSKGNGRNILISINTWMREKLITKPGHIERLKELGYIDHLSLVFGDGSNGTKQFSYDDARAICAFVDKWKDSEIDRLVVHCDQGQNRSGAVAAWAFHYLSQQKLYGKTADQFWADNKEIAPNETVARILCEVSGMKFRGEDF
jgi:predicted protein tyrosine phosphatase